jgi:hypothetical protein
MFLCVTYTACIKWTYNKEVAYARIYLADIGSIWYWHILVLIVIAYKNKWGLNRPNNPVSVFYVHPWHISGFHLVHCEGIKSGGIVDRQLIVTNDPSALALRYWLAISGNTLTAEFWQCLYHGFLINSSGHLSSKVDSVSSYLTTAKLTRL